MAKAFECDLCKKLTKSANGDDVFYPKRIRVFITYETAVNPRPLDLCWDCRLDLLKTVITSIEAKQKYTWADIKEATKRKEIL